MTANYLNVLKTFLKSLDDLVTGVTFYPDNVDVIPTGQWGQVSMISHDTDPLSKDPEHDNSGVFQISIFDDVGNTPADLLTLMDTLATEFHHGQSYEHFADVVVFIDRLTLNAPRVVGGFVQGDLSIFWKSYT